MDRDIPSVPITTLAGVASLTDLLSEMPLPTPLPQTLSNKSLLFHPRVAEEAQNLLGTRDALLVPQLVQSLLQTSADHIELKDHYAGTEPRVDQQQSMPELLKAILEKNPTVFEGPQGDVSRASAWNHTSTTGPYGQTSPCGTRVTRHTPQGSPASPTSARLHLHHRPSTISEQLPLDARPSTSAHRPLGNRPVPPWTISTQQQLQLTTVNASLNCTDERSCNEENDVPLSTLPQPTNPANRDMKSRNIPQDFDRSLPGQRLQTVSTSYTHEETKQNHESHNQRIVSASEEYVDDARRAIPTQNLPARTQDNDTAYVSTPGRECFAQACANVDAASILVPRVDVNNHVARFSQSTEKPVDCERQDHMAKPMNARGPSPAQASDAPPAPAPAPRPAREASPRPNGERARASASAPSTAQPIVRLNRLSPEAQAMMQKSLSEFAENRPELASKLGIVPNDRSTGGSDSDEDETDSRRLFESKSSNKERDSKRSIKDGDETNSSDTFSTLVGSRRRTRVSTTVNSKEKESTETSIEVSKPKLRKVERRFVPVLEKLSVEELMETNTYARFNRSIESVLENIDDNVLSEKRDGDIYSEEPPINRYQLQDLCSEAAKLKNLGAMQMIPADRLIRLLSVLESSVRTGESVSPVADPDDSEDLRQMWMETAMERVMGAVDASLTCMYVMTSPNMSKRIYLEDVIDRVILFVKYQLHNTIFPSFDPIYRVDTKKKGPNVNNRKKRHQSTRQIRDKSIIQLYNKTHELVSLLAELLTMQTLTDTIVLHASSMGVSPFFVDNIGELQLSCLKLVTTIFTRYEKHRRLLLDDVLASIARLPSSKRGLRSYRLTSGSEEHIQMLTALVLQLIQCVVALPETLSVDKSAPTTEIGPKVDKDILIHNKYDVATKTAGTFLTVFLSKCGNRNEEIDYRPLFENFVQDLLTTVNKPEWPATELLLSLLGTMLVKNFSNKGVDAALRVASLDYLGVIAAKLRKDAVMSRCKVQTIDQMIKDIKTEENKDNDEDNSTLKETKFEDPEEERTHFLQRVLLDYLAVSGQKDQAHRYARHFYLAQWYRDAMVEKNRIASGGKHETHSKKKRRNRRGMDSEESEVSEPEENEEQDAEEPNARINTELYRNIEARKQFYISKIRPFQDNLSAGNRVQVLQTYIDYRSAELISQYLASKRSFSQSFDNYLKQILLVLRETSIAIRTKAMKCMTMIVEADPSVLARADMQIGVNHSLLDISTSVREAAVDLIGKFVLSRPELIDKYYDMLLARILDTGVSVRKRVIKILKDICIECPEFDKIPEICVKMIRRVNDEDGIRKLVMEVFQNMWFTPTPERPVLDTDALLRKVVNITDVVAASKDFGIEWFEMLLLSLFKPREDKDDATKVNTEPPRAILTACRQIVDCLIESVLRLEESMGGGGSSERLIACLATLYLFAKIRPELLVKHASTLQPYLSYKCQTRSDTQIITYVAKSLELVVPLIVHPSETFLAQLEEDLIKLIIQSDKETVASCIACLGSIVNNVTRNFKLIRDCFNKFYRNLCVYKINIEKDNSQPEVEKYKPWFRRAVFTVGLLLRHFDFTDVDVIKDLPNDIKNQVFNLLTYYLHLEDDDIQANTLKAIGFICVRHYEFMLLDDLKQFYHRMFADLSAPLTMKIDALHNIEIYLLEEENRMIKQDQEWAKRSKEENLKEMGDISSGMASTVIQLYLKEILQSFVHSNVKVRHVAMRVIQLILQQGLVHPVQIVPYLICMSTDYEKMISNCADKQLQDIEKKYPGFIHMKAQYGVRLSYQLQRILQTEDIVRGFRIKEQNEYPSALNGYLYSILRNTKQQRRAIAQSVLKQFDEQVRTSLSYMLYLADNLAYFPYQVQDEPLFIIHQIDIMISVSGTNLLQAFREGLIPLHGNEQTAVSALDDDDEEDEEELFTRMPEDTSLLNDCLTAAQGCLLLLVLKQHLKDVYGISDGKILQYSPTEMAKVYEKAVNRRSNSHFNPKATLAKLREGSPPSTLDEKGRKALISQYLDFKQLMLKLDPDDEDEDEGIPGTVKATIPAIAPGQPQPDQPQPDQPTATPAEQCPLVLVKHIVSTEPPPTSTYVVTEAKSPSDVTKDSRPQVPKLVISNRRTLMATGDVTDVRRTPTTRTPRSPDKSRRHRQKRKRKKFVSSSGEDSENGFSDPDFLV